MSPSWIGDDVARVVRGWRRYAAATSKPVACRGCGGRRIAWNGWRTRSASLVVGNAVVYVPEVRCRRVRCGCCRTSWTLRPPGLCAHKHYQLCVVARSASRYLFAAASSLTNVADEVGCSRRTVKRWLRWVAAIAEPAVVMQRVVEASAVPVVMPARRVAARATKARTALGAAVLARAAEVLGALEALASAWRLEPPGLRAVVRQVVGDRSGIATYARPVIPGLARSAAGRGQRRLSGDG